MAMAMAMAMMEKTNQIKIRHYEYHRWSFFVWIDVV